MLSRRALAIDETLRGFRRVALVPLPPALAARPQRALLFSADFWRLLSEKRVLWFELGSTARSPRARARAVLLLL